MPDQDPASDQTEPCKTCKAEVKPDNMKHHREWHQLVRQDSTLPQAMRRRSQGF